MNNVAPYLAAFKNPSREFAMHPIIHDWPDDIEGMVAALKDYGCRGAVLNCPFADGFTSNEGNLAKLEAVMAAMDRGGLKYWLYDEAGYPSGMAAGLTLQGHPEYEARGFYMRRFVTYDVPKTINFQTDDQTDKIVWAATYAFSTPGLHQTVIDFGSMRPVPFGPRSLSVELRPNEALFVFCVKPAYEGSQCTHNTYSFQRYINIMDHAAVRRYLDVAYEPIVRRIPDAYRRAEAVFTDEPSLMVNYSRNYEVWPYALAPWVEGLFEKYEAEYGESLLPWLPLIFEPGDNQSAKVRIQFYRLVGKLIAEAWSDQIAAWCRKHGGTFSGHYLAEERIAGHVLSYGDLMNVLRHTGLPGFDVLVCYPEDFCYTTVKYPQMAARKQNARGMMVKICPFVNRERFMRNPLNNMTAVMGILYLGGARIVHSYFRPDFTEWGDGRLKLKGVVGREDTVWFNRYIARIGTMLDGLVNDCETFVYYPLSDMQGKIQPSHTASGHLPQCNNTDADIQRLVRAVYEAGHDFYFADSEDVLSADTSSELRISGFPVRTLIVPGAEIMKTSVLRALASLQRKGVSIFFLDRLPGRIIADDGEMVGWEPGFHIASTEAIVAHLDGANDGFRFEARGGIVLHGKFTTADNRELHYLVNKSDEAAVITFRHPHRTSVRICDPATGEVAESAMSAFLTIPAMRSMFLLFS